MQIETDHLRELATRFLDRRYSLSRLGTTWSGPRVFSKRPRRRDPSAARYSSCVQSILDTAEIALTRDLANRDRAFSVPP